MRNRWARAAGSSNMVKRALSAPQKPQSGLILVRTFIWYTVKIVMKQYRKNRKRKKKVRSDKRQKFKVEKRIILEGVVLGKLSPVIVKPEQYIVITLILACLSQIVNVRDAFHKNLAEVRKDRNWEAVKKEKVGESTSTRTTGARQNAICHCHTFGKEHLGKHTLRVY